MNFFYQIRNENYRSFISINNSYPPHLHHHVEFILVLSGEVNISLENQPYTLTCGDIFIAFPDQIHSLHTPVESKIFIVLFDIEYVQDFYKILSEYTALSPIINISALSIHGKNAISWLLYFSRDNRGDNDIKKIDGIALHDSTQYALSDNSSSELIYAKSYLTILLSEIFEQFALEKRNTLNDKNICENILIYIEQHFHENISLESTAKSLGISKYYLSQLFATKLNSTFMTYVTSKRLDLAQKLLTTTDKSVTEIAFESGFSSSRTFFRCFQNKYHISPYKFKKSHNSSLK